MKILNYQITVKNILLKSFFYIKSLLRDQQLTFNCIIKIISIIYCNIFHRIFNINQMELRNQSQLINCNQCKVKQEYIFQLKEQLIRLQVRFENKQNQYLSLFHQKDRVFKENNFDKVKAKFVKTELGDAYILKDKQTKQEIEVLKEKNQNRSIQIQTLKLQIDRLKRQQIQKTSKFQMESFNFQSQKQQLQQKIQEKRNICKLMMVKIHSLEINSKNYQQELTKMKLMNQNQNKLQREMVHYGIQSDFIENGTIFSNIIEDQLRDQIIYQFFQIFLKSFDLNRNQPSIQIYRLNLKLVDKNRMKPYCQCFSKFLWLHKDDQIGVSNIKNKQK